MTGAPQVGCERTQNGLTDRIVVASSMFAAFDGALDDYIQHLRVERGLSRHTVDGYARDLVRFGARLADEKASLGEVDEVRVAGYLVTLSHEWRSAPSPAYARLGRRVKA